MYAFEGTVIENKKGRYEDIQDFFTAQNFEVGSGWEYDHGYFDKQLQAEPGYIFIRIPVYVLQGEFGDPDAQVRLGSPFSLSHQYVKGLDDHVYTNTFTHLTTTNQFSEPADKDASLSAEEVAKAKHEIAQLERTFMKHFNLHTK